MPAPTTFKTSGDFFNFYAARFPCIQTGAPDPTSQRRIAGEASSGLTIRHRLSRGGDRQLNRALHTVILHRRQHDPATRDYIARRVADGKSARDATRILKRYLARHLYRVMQNTTPLMT